MYVNDEKKLIFLAHPRTGSRAVAKLLRDTLGFAEVGPHHSGPEEKHFQEEYRFFTTVRNHWDTWASWWFNAMGNSPEAVNRKIETYWIRNWIKGHRSYFYVNGRPEVSHNRMFWFLDLFPPPAILRYETLTEDLHSFLGAYAFGPTKIPVVGYNKFRSGTHYREVFTTEAAEAVHLTFAEEIEELGYSFS